MMPNHMGILALWIRLLIRQYLLSDPVGSDRYFQHEDETKSAENLPDVFFR